MLVVSDEIFIVVKTKTLLFTIRLFQFVVKYDWSYLTSNMTLSSMALSAYDIISILTGKFDRESLPSIAGTDSGTEHKRCFVWDHYRLASTPTDRSMNRI